MKDAIIELSVKRLQTEGLRFSLDSLARELKVSKKTIYKYFSTKEELAVAIYRKFYGDAAAKIAALLESKGSLFEILSVYSQSFLMKKEEIFNKYALNETIRTYTLSCHEKLWEQIEPLFPEDMRGAARAIIDGAYEKACASAVPPEKITDCLIKIIC